MSFNDIQNKTLSRPTMGIPCNYSMESREMESISDVLGHLRLVFENIGCSEEIRSELYKLLNKKFKIIELPNGVLDKKYKKWYTKLCVECMEQMHQNINTWYRWISFNVENDVVILTIGRTNTVASFAFNAKAEDIPVIAKLYE